MNRENMKQRLLDKLERDGVSYNVGEPGTGRLILTDDEGVVIGELDKPLRVDCETESD